MATPFGSACSIRCWSPAIGIVLATILGFIVGIARLSSNWLVAKTATGYVETIRNIPLLLQLLFWYNAVLKALPGTRDSYHFPGSIYLNNRGLVTPKPIFEPGFIWVIDCLCRGRCRHRYFSHLGAAAAGADRTAGAGFFDGARADRRPAVAGAGAR